MSSVVLSLPRKKAINATERSEVVEAVIAVINGLGIPTGVGLGVADNPKAAVSGYKNELDSKTKIVGEKLVLGR